MSEVEFFDVNEWMAEYDLSHDVWDDFKGHAEQQYCDVKLKSGDIVSPCWPKKGEFVRVDGAVTVPFSDVVRIRYYTEGYEETRGDEGDDDGDTDR